MFFEWRTLSLFNDTVPFDIISNIFEAVKACRGTDSEAEDL